MSPALKAAHLRLLEQLPRRTHEWEPTVQGWGYKRSEREIATIVAKLHDLEAQGYTRREMADMCGCTTTTVRKYLGPVKC